MKYEWKREEKALYSPKAQPETVIAPKYKCFSIEGKGGTDGEDFKNRLEVLKKVNQEVRDLPKKGFFPGGYFEYASYPIELLWDEIEDRYQLMIRQPVFVTSSVARMAITAVNSKKGHPLISEVQFLSVEDGNCVQMMYVGSHETTAIEAIKAFTKEQGLFAAEGKYKKIFMNDPLKTAAEKQKMILRVMLKEG